MNHRESPSKLRTGAPIGTATLLLIVAVVLRVYPPERDGQYPGEVPAATPAGTRTASVADAKPGELPYSDHVVTDHIRPGGGSHERLVTWNIPAPVVAPLLYELERTPHTQRYDARQNNANQHAAGWTVSATLGGAPDGADGGSELALPREAWTTAIAAVLARPSPDPRGADPGPALAGDPAAGSDSAAASAEPGDRRNGGSGYVRIESRGRMNWLWDAEVLRLEPAR